MKRKLFLSFLLIVASFVLCRAQSLPSGYYVIRMAYDLTSHHNRLVCDNEGVLSIRESQNGKYEKSDIFCIKEVEPGKYTVQNVVSGRYVIKYNPTSERIELADELEEGTYQIFTADGKYYNWIDNRLEPEIYYSNNEYAQFIVNATTYQKTYSRWEPEVVPDEKLMELGIRPLTGPVADILNIEFNADGSATDVSPMKNTVVSVGNTTTAYNFKYGKYMATMRDAYNGATDHFYKIDYAPNHLEGDSTFYKALQGQHTLESLFALQTDVITSAEAKWFGSTKSGGTAFVLATKSRGKKVGGEIAFIPNVSPDGSENTWKWATSGIQAQVGTFYHAVGVWDGETASIYINGEKKNTVAAEGLLRYPTAANHWFCIGGSCNGTTANSGGSWDVLSAKIYSFALTDEDVSTIWGVIEASMLSDDEVDEAKAAAQDAQDSLAVVVAGYTELEGDEDEIVNFNAILAKAQLLVGEDPVAHPATEYNAMKTELKEAYPIDTEGLKAKVGQIKKYSLGTGLNQYIWSGKDGDWITEWETKVAEYETLANDANAGYTAVNNAKAAVDQMQTELAINMPQDGTFLRVLAAVIPDGYLMSVNHTNDYLSIKEDDGTSKESIFLYKDGKLLSYSKGYYLTTNNGRLSIPSEVTEGVGVEFGQATITPNTYTLKYDGNNYTSLFTSYVYKSDIEKSKRENVYLYEVTELPITMNESQGAYYATVNLPVAVELPEGLKAYGAVASESSLNLQRVEGNVLAANTPVVLYSESNVTSLAISKASGTPPAQNELAGTIAKEATGAATCYVLSGDATGVGFYKYTAEVKPGFKAYLNSGAGANKFTFAFPDGDLTAVIDAIQKAENNGAIYDLEGRKVANPVKGGVYIQGGKKIVY